MFCVRAGAGTTSATSNAFQCERGLLQGLSPAPFNVYLQAIIDEVSHCLGVPGITGGLVRTRYDGDKLKWLPAGNGVDDILVR